jgi:prepilin-type N-terminal cleavage/methylation domain-containing protein
MKAVKKAFSILELAVVIAIIGLLISGVTYGGSLIESARKNKILSDIATIKSAVNSFYFIYKQLPGDYDNAEEKWGAYHVSSAPNGTVNGNGDKIISWNSEGLRVFHQLQLANIITGIYNSSSSGNSAMRVISSNANVKKGPYQNSAYAFYNESLNNVVNNYVVAGRLINYSGLTTNKDAIISSSEAFSIDQKIDDSNPSKGSVRASYAVNISNSTHPNGTKCINGSNNQTGLDYVSGDTNSISCVLYFTLNVN